MKYFGKLLQIFCTLIILHTISGELPADCPSEGCEPCKAKYLNDQIREKLKKYPDVYVYKLKLEETFHELRSNLQSAMIRKPKADDACEKAEQTLKNFQQFMWQYENTKQKVENLMEKLKKMQKFSHLSEEEKVEAYRLLLVLQASADIDTAKHSIWNTKVFIQQLSPLRKINNDSRISDEDKASLVELLRNTTKALGNMNNATEVDEAPKNPVQDLLITLTKDLANLLVKPLPNKATPFIDLLNIVAESLNDVLKYPSLYQYDTLFEQSVNTLAERIAKIINKEPGKNNTELTESINKTINQLLRNHPKKVVKGIKLNEIFNAKRKHLIEVILPLYPRPGAIDLAEQAMQDFIDFVEKYKSINHRLESAVEKLETFEANPTYTMQTKYQALKCKTELEKSETIDEARKALKNCVNYSESFYKSYYCWNIFAVLYFLMNSE